MKRIRRALIGASLLALQSCARLEMFTSLDSVEGAIEDLAPKAIALTGLEVATQPTRSACGIASVTILSNYLNDTNCTVDEVIARNGVDATQAVNPERIIAWIAKEAPGHSAAYYHGEEPDGVIRRIHASLLGGMPVLVFFGAPNPYNKPLYDFHTSVIYGIDLDQKTILIANPYGYSETIGLVEFLNRMSFTELRRYSIVQQTIIRNGLVDSNMLFIVT